MRATRAEIQLTNFYQNLDYFRSRLTGRHLCLVVKGNAYGHGLVELSQKASVDAFAVATIEEGAALREAGICQPILLLVPHQVEEISDLCVFNLEPLVSSGDYLSDYQREAVKYQHKLRLHIEVDTGMNRGGAPLDEVLKLAQQILGYDHLELYGFCSHFSSADTDPVQTRVQLDNFRQTLAQLHKYHIFPPCVHMANSAATLHYPETHFNMVRVGIGVYGYGSVGLSPVLNLKSKIGLVKRIPKGAKVSYGGTWQAQRDSLLGLLPIGYADGYSYLLSNLGQVQLQDEFCPLVGRVCMDQVIIDLTDWEHKHPDSGPLLGQEVELLGTKFSAEDIAKQIGSIPYEILTSISARVPRVYIP